MFKSQLGVNSVKVRGQNGAVKEEMGSYWLLEQNNGNSFAETPPSALTTETLGKPDL